MKRNLFLAGFCALLLLQIPAQAGYAPGAPTAYFSNFNDLTNGSSLSNWVQLPNGSFTQDGGATSTASLTSGDLTHPGEWVTTDQNQNDGVTTSWGIKPGDKWAAIGGFSVPSVVQTELWTPVNMANITFSVDFGITASDLSAPTQDIFGWTVRNTSGDKLFAVIFKPYDSTTYAVYREYATGVDVPVAYGISLGAQYSLTINTNLYSSAWQGMAAHSWTATITPLTSLLVPTGDPSTTFGSTDVGGANATDIGSVAATYILSDPQLSGTTPTNAGDNLMLFDNYSVPEPSSVALVIGGLGLLAAFQRRRSSIR